MDSLVERN